MGNRGKIQTSPIKCNIIWLNPPSVISFGTLDQAQYQMEHSSKQNIIWYIRPSAISDGTFDQVQYQMVRAGKAEHCCHHVRVQRPALVFGPLCCSDLPTKHKTPMQCISLLCMYAQHVAMHCQNWILHLLKDIAGISHFQIYNLQMLRLSATIPS